MLQCRIILNNLPRICSEVQTGFKVVYYSPLLFTLYVDKKSVLCMPQNNAFQIETVKKSEPPSYFPT